MQQAAAGKLVVAEKAKLRRVLGRVDLILFTGAAIVALDTLSFTASAGGEAVTWLVVSFALFLVPYGLLTAELGTTWPVEGGPYIWVRMAMGRLAGSVTAVLYWITNPIWLGGTLSATAIAAVNTFVLGSKMGQWAEILFGLAFVWAAVGVAIAALRVGKWIPNVGLVVKGLLIIFFASLAIVYLIQHGHSGTIGVSDLKPTSTGFLAVIGVLMFNWVGFELANGASEEMVDPKRDVPQAILRSGLLSAYLYGVLLVAIMLVIPKKNLSSVAGFTDAYRTVATTLGVGAHAVGIVIAFLVVVALLVSGTTWLIGSDRIQAVAALDGAAPSPLGHFAKVGTPIAVNILSGITGSAFVFFVFLFTSGSLRSFFSVMIALVISLTALSYFFIFLSLPLLRRKYPDVPRPYRVPGGMLGCWICAIVTDFFVLVTGITLLWPGLIDGLLGHTYSIRDSWGVTRLFFESVTLGTFGAVVLIAIAFWYVGKLERERGLTGNAEVPVTAAPEFA